MLKAWTEVVYVWARGAATSCSVTDKLLCRLTRGLFAADQQGSSLDQRTPSVWFLLELYSSLLLKLCNNCYTLTIPIPLDVYQGANVTLGRIVNLKL